MRGSSGLRPEEEDLLPEGGRSCLAFIRRRYACKRFAKDRVITDLLARYILECARLAPSSFGLEHWKFLALRRPSIDEGFVRACLGQDCVATADLAVVILVRREKDYLPEADFVRTRAERFPGGYPVFLPDYRPYHEELAARGRVEAWAQAQSYIACAHMLFAAAACEIESCPIEGFIESELLASIGVQATDWGVGIVTVFGYPDEVRRQSVRADFDELVELR